MSENARKDCRTQGKYSERSPLYDDKKYQKRQDKRVKVSPTVYEPQEKKFHKRRSDGDRASSSSLTNENESPVRYEENSNHTFSQLEIVKKPIEIKSPGKHILSKTENGESVVYYHPNFLEKWEASDFMDRLLNTTNWNAKNIIINGMEVPQPRLVAWYGPFPYTYSGATLEPLEMPDTVLEIKNRVEDYLKDNGINVELNSVLLNLYRDNKDSVAWHSDDELTMGVSPTIASVSLGEIRRFEMRRKFKQNANGSSPDRSDERVIRLTSGSLLIMDGCMQEDWQHRVPKEYHDKYERINLTFRTVYKLENSTLRTYPKKQCWNTEHKIPSTSISDNGVTYDDEDFPPLNSDSSPVCSNVRVSPEPNVSKEVRSYETTESYRRRSDEGSSSYKSSLKNRSEVSESHNNNDVNYDNENSSPGKSDSILLCSNLKTSSESNNSREVKTRYESNGSHKRRDNEGSFSHKTFSRYRREVSESHDNNNEVNYDDENSSPLDRNSSPLYSNTKTSPEYNVPKKVKPRYESKESNRRRSYEDSSSRKNSFRNRNEVSESHDNNSGNCDNENSSPFNSDSSPQYSNLKASSESNSSREVNMRYKSNGPHRKRNNEGSVYHDRFYRSRNEVSESQHTWNTEQSGRNKTYFKSNNKNYSSNKIVANEPFHNKTTFKSGDKIVRSENNYCTDSRSSLKANRIDEKEKMWDSVLQFVDDDILKNHAVINKSEEQATKPYDNRNRSILNNLNEDKKNEKIDIQNKNVCAYYSNSTGNIVASCTAIEREDQYVLTEEIYNVNTNYSITNMHENAPGVKNELTSNLNRSTLNAEAKEFVPYLGTSSAFPEISYETFDLENLMTYKSDLMSGDQLKLYTNALKTKVSMQMPEFNSRDQEELKFICELIDEDQTPKYLKLITSRMCLIIRGALTHPISPDCQNPHGGNPRMFNHGNQNHSLGRRHQNSRVGAFRH